MISPEKPAPEGRGKGVRKWDYLPVANGKSDVGFLAGEPCGCWVHFIGGSKPCRRKMTKSKLHCAFCEEKWEPVWRGFTPIYDREYTRRFVLITEDYYESVMEIPLHSQVRLSRDKEKMAPIVIRQEMWRTQPMPLTHERRDKVELMAFLLRVLWKDAELVNFAEQKELPIEVDEAPPAEPQVKFAKGPLDRLTAAQAREDKKAEEEKMKIGNTMSFLLGKHTNGNGKKKPKEE